MGRRRDREPQWKHYIGWSRQVPLRSITLLVTKTRGHFLFLNLLANYLQIIFVRHKHWDNFTFLLNRKDQVEKEMNPSISTQHKQKFKAWSWSPWGTKSLSFSQSLCLLATLQCQEQTGNINNEAPSYGLAPSASRPLLQKINRSEDSSGEGQLRILCSFEQSNVHCARCIIFVLEVEWGEKWKTVDLVTVHTFNLFQKPSHVIENNLKYHYTISLYVHCSMP